MAHVENKHYISYFAQSSKYRIHVIIPFLSMCRLDSHCHTNICLSRRKLWLPTPCIGTAINISVDSEGHE